MAGKTIDEAHTVQESAHAAQKTSSGNSSKAHGAHGTLQPGATTQANTAQANPPPPANDNKMLINGVYYIPAPNPPPSGDNSTHMAIIMAPYDEEEYIAVLATTKSYFLVKPYRFFI